LLSQTALRKLRSQQEDFAHNLEARLSVNLRLELSVSVAGIQTISFQRFVELAGTPLHFTLFKLDPLRGIGLLEIPPQLGLSVVNRLLGGSGALDNAARALTDIEAAVLDQVSSVILAEWAAPWSHLQELKPAILGHEIDARFLNAISRETMVLEITFDAAVGETQGRFRIGLPYASFEPLIRRLSGEADQKEGGASATAAAAAPRWNPQLDDVPVKLAAVCTGLSLNLQTLGTLKVGDMVPVDAHRFHDVQVRLGELAKFVGILGSSEGRWAIQLTGKLEA
jgi:flagellar motor switch protein FliM